jgi:transcriptional regulator with XRE-family HTH domain
MFNQRFRDRLKEALAAKRAANPRYSLRAFAQFLKADHSTLSQILRGNRPAPARQIRAWCARLRLSAEEATAYIVAEHAPDIVTTRRQAQLHHWTAEALAITTELEHWEILRLVRQPNFRADSRWIAARIGVSVDQVNIAISRLFRLRLMEAKSRGKWNDLTGLPRLTERDFRRVALARVREKAAE